MRVIYHPTGRALEYGLLALNPWGKSWCSHDCSYCYCPSMFHMTRQQWRAQGFRPRKNLIKQLRRDCEALRGTNERVHCCFAGDLYNPEAIASGLTRQILETFQEFDVPFQVLTKGGMRAAADFDLYGPNDAFATTMTFLDDRNSLQYEPGAALPSDRITAMMFARDRGIETWVSLEPVLDSWYSLRIICRTQASVNLYKIGKLNHDAVREKAIDWRLFGETAIELCEQFGKPYYIKTDLAKHLEGVKYTNTDTRRVQRPDKEAR